MTFAEQTLVVLLVAPEANLLRHFKKLCSTCTASLVYSSSDLSSQSVQIISIFPIRQIYSVFLRPNWLSYVAGQKVLEKKSDLPSGSQQRH